jgi:hypothetical protein
MRALTRKLGRSICQRPPLQETHEKESTMPLGTILESPEHEFDDEDWEDEELGTDEEELDLDEQDDLLEDDDDI